MKRNDHGEDVPETYGEAIGLVADAAGVFGEDSVADAVDAAMAIKLGDRYEVLLSAVSDDESSEIQIQRALLEVYIDALETTLTFYRRRLAELKLS